MLIPIGPNHGLFVFNAMVTDQRTATEGKKDVVTTGVMAMRGDMAAVAKQMKSGKDFLGFMKTA